MATKLVLRNTQTNGIGSTYYDMLVSSFGSSTDTGVVNTTSGGTEIQWTKTAGGAVMQWVSGRVPAGGFTLTSTDISIWAAESNGLANCGGRYRIFKRDRNGVETELGGGPFDDGVEFGTSAAEFTWTGNVTDTAFAEDDRILLKLYITNVGTMGSGRTCTVTFNGADAATGDSFLNIAETVSFKAEGDRPIEWYTPFKAVKLAAVGMAVLATASPTFLPRQDPVAADLPFGWYQSFVQPSTKPKDYLHGGISAALRYEPIAATPATLEWAAPSVRQPRPAIAPQGAVSWAPQVFSAQVDQPFGWQQPFPQPGTKRPDYLHGGISAALRYEPIAITPASLEWQRAFHVPASRLRVTLAGAVVWTPQEISSAATPTGWQNPTGLASQQRFSISGNIAWAPQVVAPAAETTPDLGWLRQFVQPDARPKDRLFGGISAALQIGTDQGPATPAEFGWYSSFLQPAVQPKAVIRGDMPGAIKMGTLVPEIGWQSPAGLPPRIKTVLRGSVAWAPQVIAMPAATPAAIEWQAPAGLPPKARTTLRGSIAWAPQEIVGPAVGQTLGWASPADIRRPIASRAFLGGAVAIGWAQPLPTQGWLNPAGLTAQTRRAPQGSIAWTPQASFSLTATPSEFGWYSGFAAPKPVKTAIHGQVSWTAQIITPSTATPAVMEWQRQFSVPQPQPKARIRGTISWSVQEIAPPTVTPAEFGWYLPFVTTLQGHSTAALGNGTAWEPQEFAEPITPVPPDSRKATRARRGFGAPSSDRTSEQGPSVRTSVQDPRIKRPS